MGSRVIMKLKREEYLMKHRVMVMIAVGVVAVGLAACKSKVQESAPSPAPMVGAPGAAPPSANRFTGKVIETMDSGGYTYVQVDNGTEKIWAAAPQFAVQTGDTVTVPEGMPMENYESKTLNRKFDRVFFVGAIGKGDQLPAGTAAMPTPGMGAPGTGGEPAALPDGGHPKMDPDQAAKDAKVSFDGIKKADKTIGEIFAEQKSMGGKTVAVRGKVVKFSPQIMSKNWIHVQDGTGQVGGNDLTVTTADEAKVGDTVLITGTITLNKDFGMGYKYDLIIEDGKIKIE